MLLTFTKRGTEKKSGRGLPHSKNLADLTSSTAKAPAFGVRQSSGALDWTSELATYLTTRVIPFTRVTIDAGQIVDWSTFHSVFARAFGFPEFYGRNMDAWIDCLTSLDAPEEGMTAVHAPPGGVVVLELSQVRLFAGRCPEIYEALIECAAFVNHRRIEQGEGPVLSLSFSATAP